MLRCLRGESDNVAHLRKWEDIFKGVLAKLRMNLLEGENRVGQQFRKETGLIAQKASKCEGMK